MLDQRPWPFDGLPMFRYGGLIIDIPWRTELYSEKGYEKAPEAHYDTMPLEEIMEMPFGNLAGSDCLIFFWTTATHVDQAIKVMEHNGFKYKTFICWKKTKASGAQHLGPGYIVRSVCELCLIGKVGNPVLNRKVSANTRNYFESVEHLPPNELPSDITAPIREHSRKPDEFRQLMEDYLPDSYFVADIFAREKWARGDVWGNEVNKYSGEQS